MLRCYNQVDKTNKGKILSKLVNLYVMFYDLKIGCMLRKVNVYVNIKDYMMVLEIIYN